MINKLKSVPDGYLTVGQLAKKMRTTVRTLQFYDRIGLLIPAGESAGGRRLYDDADVIRLHQILALKQLGFSLEDIRTRLVDLESPSAVADVLSQQAASIREQMATLAKAVSDLEALRVEVLAMDRVDFTRYATIIMMLKSSNDSLWILRLAGEQMRHRLAELDLHTQAQIGEKVMASSAAAGELHAQGAAPDGAAAQVAAGLMWEAAFAFAGDNPSMLTEMDALYERHGEWEGEFAAKYNADARAFMERAMPIWLANNAASLSPVWQEWIAGQQDWLA